jgi:anti-sigma regulatory factor (Ser/Thr protein kinase)
MRWERTFPSTTQSVVRARRLAIETLTGLDPQLTDAFAVMVSELVTNSVRHAASEFTVAIDRDAHRVRVAVSDLGEQRPSMRNPDPTEQSGRGLQIVNALSDDWGIMETPGRSGKTVWFVVALPKQVGGTDAASVSASASQGPVAAPRPDVTGGDSPRIALPKQPRGTSRRHQESRAGRVGMCRV